MNNIPLVNLAKQYQTIDKEIERGIKQVFEVGNYILGKQVEVFEGQFASFIGTKFCIGVASGTDAILLSLQALGVGPGDEVITQANTFISSVLPIIQLGAKPVLVDIDPKTYQINTELLEKAITKRTKVILPVHLYGTPAPMIEIKKIAKKFKISILEDACQAHGSSINGEKCGSFSEVAAFSFYPGKNLGAAGDGGAVVTNNRKIADKIIMMRNIGQSKKYVHQILGYNSRLDTIHAAVLSIKLKHLEKWNQKRRKIADLYRRNLEDLSITLPPNLPDGIIINYHLFVIRTKRRDRLMNFLADNGIQCGIHYPIPIHLQKSLKFLGFKNGDFPQTESISKEILSLPMYPELTEEEIKYISLIIKEFFKVK